METDFEVEHPVQDYFHRKDYPPEFTGMVNDWIVNGTYGFCWPPLIDWLGDHAAEYNIDPVPLYAYLQSVLRAFDPRRKSIAGVPRLKIASKKMKLTNHATWTETQPKIDTEVAMASLAATLSMPEMYRHTSQLYGMVVPLLVLADCGVGFRWFALHEEMREVKEDGEVISPGVMQSPQRIMEKWGMHHADFDVRNVAANYSMLHGAQPVIESYLCHHPATDRGANRKIAAAVGAMDYTEMLLADYCEMMLRHGWPRPQCVPGSIWGLKSVAQLSHWAMRFVKTIAISTSLIHQRLRGT